MAKLKPEVEEAVAKAVADYPKAWVTGVCAGVLVDKATAQVDERSKHGYVCHAFLNRLGNKTIVVNAHKKNWGKQHPEFIRWIAAEAPFRHALLNRKNEAELFSQASVIDREAAGPGGALWLCKAIRHFEEDTWKLKLWDTFREAGLNGLQAFMGCDILDCNGNPASATHVGLFHYSKPTVLREVYDELRTIKKITDNNAAKGKYFEDGGKIVKSWGMLKSKISRKPDGWGGFTEIKQACEPAEYIASLKEIFEGDPKNVGD
jgi:hypothetical protein